MPQASFYSCRFLAAARLFILGLVPMLGACAPDMVVKDIHPGQFTGGNLAMTATVQNRWIFAAGESTTLVERRYSWTDPFVEVSRLATPSLGWLDRKEFLLWAFSPDQVTAPGTCMQVRVCADTGDVVNELFENNNCKTRLFINDRYCGACDRCCDQVLPQTFDWHNLNGTNWVTGVHDQSNCGSCWAFAAVAAVEAKHNIQGQTAQTSPIDLSEQQLVSCPGGGGSCRGGSAAGALGYIRTNGLVAESTLPYSSGGCGAGTDTSPCVPACTDPAGPRCANPLLTEARCAALDEPAAPGGPNPPAWRIYEARRVTGGTVDDIKRALLCHGPLSVCGTWYIDSDGIGHGHCVLLVGWDNNGWIFKNSWGTGYASGGHSGGYGGIPFSGHTFNNIINSAWYALWVRKEL